MRPREEGSETRIDGSRWETPSPGGEKQPLPRPGLREMQPTDVQELPHTRTQHTHTHTLLNASCKAAQRHG